MKKVIISTDSPADLAAALAEKYSVAICPLHVILNGEDKLDGVNVTPDALIDNYKQTKSLPSTSAIPVGEYTEKFAKLTADGASVVHISLSSGVSSSHRNAVIAAEDFDNVYVVDSKLLTTAMSILIVKAAHMAESGMSAQDIAKELEELREKVDISFVLDNLEFLAKGGRCSAVTALGANILGIRPSLEMRDGKLGVCKKYRGKIDKVQLQYLNERIEAMGDVDDEIAFLTYSPMDETQLAELKKATEACGKFKEVVVVQAGCTITAHCGPNCVGIIALKK
ncbi:MAG: DegV family protein [Clostridia bacterium]|nr:DegV family protein [Clostridia bacterium]